MSKSKSQVASAKNPEEEVDDTAEFLKWKAQFDEEKNACPLGLGISSALSSNTAASTTRLTIIGSIQEPQQEEEYDEDTKPNPKNLRFGTGNTIRKHLEDVRNGTYEREALNKQRLADAMTGGHKGDKEGEQKVYIPQPRGLNEREKAQLKTLFEKKKAVSF